MSSKLVIRPTLVRNTSCTIIRNTSRSTHSTTTFPSQLLRFRLQFTSLLQILHLHSQIPTHHDFLLPVPLQRLGAHHLANHFFQVAAPLQVLGFAGGWRDGRLRAGEGPPTERLVERGRDARGEVCGEFPDWVGSPGRASGTGCCCLLAVVLVTKGVPRGDRIVSVRL